MALIEELEQKGGLFATLDESVFPNLIDKLDLNEVVDVLELPWLFANCLGGIAAFFIIGYFGESLRQVAYLNFKQVPFAFAVGLSVVCSMSIAALIGSMIPMTFAKMEIDPAVAPGPFVTTSIDILSVLFYFLMATSLLGI